MVKESKDDFSLFNRIERRLSLFLTNSKRDQPVVDSSAISLCASSWSKGLARSLLRARNLLRAKRDLLLFLPNKLFEGIIYSISRINGPLYEKRVIGKRSCSFHQFLRSYTISSFSIYKKREAIAMAGKTRPTNGTKIDGKYAAAILKTPFFFCSFIIPHEKGESCFQCILSLKCRGTLTRPFFSSSNLEY